MREHVLDIYEDNQPRTDTSQKCFRFARDLFDNFGPHEPPVDLRAYHEPCKVEGDVEFGDLVGHGCLYWAADRQKFRVKVNQRLPRTFGRFVWAHELAHAIQIFSLNDFSVPEAGPLKRKLSVDACSKEEFLCDAVASELLIPRKLFDPMVDARDAGIKAILELSKRFDVPVTTAARRYVRSVAEKCLLIFWDVASLNPITLRPRVNRYSRSFPRRAKVSEFVGDSNQPASALISGKLRRGPEWIDLGLGKECVYIESIPCRLRNRNAILSLLILDRDSHSSPERYPPDELQRTFGFPAS